MTVHSSEHSPTLNLILLGNGNGQTDDKIKYILKLDESLAHLVYEWLKGGTSEKPDLDRCIFFCDI